MKKLTALFLSLVLGLGVLCACGAGSGGKKKLTVMMYVVGSDLERKCGYATKDFEEIFASKLDLNDVNFVIHTGGTQGWMGDISAQTNSTFSVTEKENKKSLSLLATTDEVQNMGDPETLSDFLNYAYTNFPAEKYALICWDHGGGPNTGFGRDELSKDTLEVSEFAKAFSDSPFKGENKLDWIGFDACLMGSAEVGDALKDYAHYLIASEETEPGEGWDYSFLSLLNGKYDVNTFAEQIAKTYYDSALKEYVERYGSEESDPKPLVTLSCVDLSRSAELTEALNGLFGEMNKGMQSGELPTLFARRSAIHSFAENVTSVRGTEYDMVDVGDMAKAFESVYPEQTKKLREALDKYVVSQQNGIDFASGVSLYFPLSGYTRFFSQGQNSYANYAACPEYVSFVSGFTDLCYQGLSDNGKVSLKTGKIDGTAKGDQVVFTLTDEQKKNFGKAYVHVLQKISLDEHDNNSYRELLMNYAVQPDENGNFSIHSDLAVPVVCSNEDNTPITILPMQQVSAKEDGELYQTLNTIVATDSMSFPMCASRFVSINAQKPSESDRLRVIDIQYRENANAAVETSLDNVGKNDADADDWNIFANITTAFMSEHTADGYLLPAAMWNASGSMEMRPFPYESFLNLQMLPLSRCGESSPSEFYFQLVTEDIHGIMSASELFPIKVGESGKEVSQKTAKGELTYSVYDDRAEVIRYKGTDDKLTIPAVFQEKPVRRIGSEFMEKNAKISELTIESPETALSQKSFSSPTVGGVSFDRIILPEGYKTIPYGAFEGCRAQEIVLPKSLEAIEDDAFAYCTNLMEMEIPAGVTKLGKGVFNGAYFRKELKVNAGNKSFKIQDGFLLSADGTKLYARTQKGNSCVIPNGVEEITEYACVGGHYYSEDYLSSEGNEVRSVTLPDSVKTIRANAFHGCVLAELAIPDSVTYIGHNAFANYDVRFTMTDSLSGDNELSRIKKLTIGSGLRFLGMMVFGKNDPETVEVSDANPYFSAKNGKLMNKAGDYAIELAEQNQDALKAETEYKAMKLLEQTIDFSRFKESGAAKEFDGNTFYTSWNNNAEALPFIDTMKLSGVTLPFPCKTSDLLNAGFSYYDEADKSGELKPDDSIGYGSWNMYMTDENKELFHIFIMNDTGKALNYKDCTVNQISVSSQSGVLLELNGVSSKAKLQEVIKSFDLPANVSVEYDTFNQDAATADIALTYHVDFKEKNYLDYSITVSFVYDLENNTISNDRMVAYITPKTK